MLEDSLKKELYFYNWIINNFDFHIFNYENILNFKELKYSISRFYNENLLPLLSSKKFIDKSSRIIRTIANLLLDKEDNCS